MSALAAGQHWTDSHITYAFAAQTYAGDAYVPFTGAIPGGYQAVIEAAFAKWASVTGLTFERVADAADKASAADIRIGWGSFGTGAIKLGDTILRYEGTEISPDTLIRLEHPAERALVADGAGKLVYAGTITDLYGLALHEIGHSLGLDHSHASGSIMTASVVFHDLGQTDIAEIRALYAGLTDQQFSVASGYVAGSTYSGPVDHLQLQYLGTAASDVVGGTGFDDFINTLGGDDAMNGGAGSDVLDGGTGSNFMTGGTGSDVFFSDGRSGGATWSTITDWQAGEQLCLWGWRPGVSTVQWVEQGGVGAYRGATMHADLDGDGATDASVTWSGLTHAQIAAPVGSDGLLWF